MLTGLLGRKVGMTQVFGPNGTAIPVTVIEAGPCVVTQVKTAANDGYEAVQLGFGDGQAPHPPDAGTPGAFAAPDRAPAPQAAARSGEVAPGGRQRPRRRGGQRDATTEADEATETEADEAEGTAQSERPQRPATPSARRRRGAGKALGPFALLREVKLLGGAVCPPLATRSRPTCSAVGEQVDVIGDSKGKGFGGVMKRHGFRGGPRTHGQSDRERRPGSIGPGTTPGRVYKGTRMAGRMGGDRVTVKALEIVAVRPGAQPAGGQRLNPRRERQCGDDS